MGKTCEACGCTQPSTVSWGPLTASDEPMRVLHDGHVIPFTPTEAATMFELVRHGRVSRDRMFSLSPNAADGLTSTLLSVRIRRMREKLHQARVAVRIACDWGYGYRLEAIA